MGAPSVNWKTWLLPPTLADWQKRAMADLRTRVPRDRGGGGTVWILSSGTQSVGQVKAIGLQRAAIEASAAAVNRFLQAGRRDRWLLAIPAYHVGGFSIGVRAALSGSRVFRLPSWQAPEFAALVARDKITLTSLVPTQVHDLVAAGLRAPPSLRAIVVGGGALDPVLYSAARALGWPVLPSYGLTETSSQVATAALESLEHSKYPDLAILPHAQIELRDQRIFVRAESLCHWVAVSDGERFTLEDPRRDGWLGTEDLGEWRVGALHVLGRRDDVVKVLGVLVPVAQVQSELAAPDTIVVAVPGGREGQRLLAISCTRESLATLRERVTAYNGRARGPFRVAQLVWVPELPRTALGKIKKAELLERLGLRV